MRLLIEDSLLHRDPAMASKKLQNLLKRVEKFCSTKVKGNCGWPLVSNADREELHKLMRGIVDMHWSRDCDGVLPIQFSIVDRTTSFQPYAPALPYLHKIKTMKGLVEAADSAQNAIGSYHNFLQDVVHTMRDLAKSTEIHANQKPSVG